MHMFSMFSFTCSLVLQCRLGLLLSHFVPGANLLCKLDFQKYLRKHFYFCISQRPNGIVIPVYSKKENSFTTADWPDSPF